MKLRHSLFIAAAVVAAAFGAARADLTYTQGSGTTIFDFVCFTTKHCSAHVTIDSTGTEVLPATHADAIAATPACSAAPCATTIGNVGIDPTSGKATPAFINLALPATTTTQIIALSGSTKTYITSLKMMASGAVNLTLKYGTGSNCGTGTTTLEGPYPLAAQAGVAVGAGSGAVIIVPAAQAVCVTTDASVSGFVSMTYQQF